MIRYLAIGFTIIMAIMAWAALILFGASEGWGREALTRSETPPAFVDAARAMIDAEHEGNLGLILIENGAVAESHFTSIGDPVGPDSLFQVASLSKWLTAWGVMTLVEDGAIDLDAPVSDYLTRWQLPPAAYDNDGVTVRRLLSHMAGLGDGLGYAGFDTDEEVQSLEDSLTHAADASPGTIASVRVSTPPGEAWNYSGGGYTLLQLVIEEVSGQSFNTYMRERIFEPLGMMRTTFDLDEARATGLAANYNAAGEAEPLRRYTSLAATSLHTSAGDLALFLQAQSPQSSPVGQGVLAPETLRAMRVSHAREMGADIWGLGVMLYAPNNRGDFIVGHDGNNEPAINSAVRMDPETGDGIIVLETGSELLAPRVAGEWVFWKTGNVDNLLFVMELGNTIRTIVIGAFFILMAGLLWGWRIRRPAARASDE
ncbi:MAG: serine hydrolase domain-containing protein [Parasphingopyxis sp.]